MKNLIVIEGSCDGIGKSTQFKLLKEHLEKDGEKIITHHFPSYGTYQAKGVEEYLAGNFGLPQNLSPYFINNLYAYDRIITWLNNLKEAYLRGDTILLDRYTTSSLIYQSALMDNPDIKKLFIDYVCDFEYNKLGIKEPDKVIFLTAPFDLVTKLRSERRENEGISNDIHEQDLSFMRKVYDNANMIAEYLDWDIIECSKDNKIDSIENIHNKVYQKVKS